jgi:hypothetical protein
MNKVVILGFTRKVRVVIFPTFIPLCKDSALKEFHERAEKKCGNDDKDQTS